MKGGAKSNNVGMPADRREDSASEKLGNTPAENVELKGSGYEKRWTKPGASLPEAGKTSKNKGNGSW